MKGQPPKMTTEKTQNADHAGRRFHAVGQVILKSEKNREVSLALNSLNAKFMAFFNVALLGQP